MKTITYKNKQYPVRVLTMSSPEAGGVRTYTIADEALFNAISEENKHEDETTVEGKIDQQIYFYVEEGCLELSAEEICKDCLDIEFEFISEETDGDN